MNATERSRIKKTVKAHLREIRRHVAEANTWMDAGDLSRAYEAAEKAQHESFDAKDAIRHAIDRTINASAS
jgi:hypothetical protein